MLRRLVLLPLLAAAAFALPAVASASSTASQSPFGDDVTIIPAWRLSTSTDFWGGAYTVAGGEQVHVFTSDVFPVDEAANQAVADFLARTVHGSELSTVQVFRVSSREITEICGSADALACYDPTTFEIVTPAEDISSDLSADSALLHEYGHHVAENRVNAPWPAVDWGTKRWATYENVCRDSSRGDVSPGDEGARYPLNPGEGFAEAYRVLNEARLQLPEAPWLAVSHRFFPDATALGLIRQDVLQPWEHRTVVRLSGRLAPKRSRTYRIKTPLDGDFTVRWPAGIRLQVLGASSRRTGRTRERVARVCGQRTVRVRATDIAKRKLRYRLTVAKP
jgi:hypothetical protein